eukprot:80210_1
MEPRPQKPERGHLMRLIEERDSARSPYQCDAFTPRVSHDWGDGMNSGGLLESKEAERPQDMDTGFQIPTTSLRMRQHDKGRGRISISQFSEAKYDEMGSDVAGSRTNETSKFGSDFPSSQPQSATITVFGFPRARIDLVLARFRKFGKFIKFESRQNWVDITFQHPLEASQALSMNGLVMDGFMIGVKMHTGIRTEDSDRKRRPEGPLMGPQGRPGTTSAFSPAAAAAASVPKRQKLSSEPSSLRTVQKVTEPFVSSFMNYARSWIPAV